MVIVFEWFAGKQSFRPVTTTDHCLDSVGSQKIASKQQNIFCKPVKQGCHTMLCCWTAGTKPQAVI